MPKISADKHFILKSGTSVNSILTLDRTHKFSSIRVIDPAFLPPEAAKVLTDEDLAQLIAFTKSPVESENFNTPSMPSSLAELKTLGLKLVASSNDYLEIPDLGTLLLNL